VNPRTRATVPLLLASTLLAATGLAGCGGDEPAAAPVDPTVAESPVEPAESVESAESSESVEPVDSEAVGPADDGSAALDFFRSTEADCAAFAAQVGNPTLPASYFSDAVVSEDLGNESWLVTDGAGNALVVDLSARVVHGVDGPSGVLPTEYSFGCPETLYLGSLPS